MLCATLSQNADLLSQLPHEHRCDNMYVHIVMSQAEWYGANQVWQEMRHRLERSARPSCFDCSGNMSVHPRFGGEDGVPRSAQIPGVSLWQRTGEWAAGCRRRGSCVDHRQHHQFSMFRAVAVAGLMTVLLGWTLGWPGWSWRHGWERTGIVR